MSASQPEPWLDIAKEDLQVARVALREGHPAHACFLSQQCIEKCLKAYLVARARDYPRIHNLVDLLGRCTSLDAQFADFADDCRDVDLYYVPTRYPPGIPGAIAEGTPDRKAAEDAISSAERILHFVEQKLR